MGEPANHKELSLQTTYLHHHDDDDDGGGFLATTDPDRFSWASSRSTPESSSRKTFRTRRELGRSQDAPPRGTKFKGFLLITLQKTGGSGREHQEERKVALTLLSFVSKQMSTGLSSSQHKGPLTKTHTLPCTLFILNKSMHSGWSNFPWCFAPAPVGERGDKANHEGATLLVSALLLQPSFLSPVVLLHSCFVSAAYAETICTFSTKFIHFKFTF